MTNHKDWGPVAEMPKDAINQHTASEAKESRNGGQNPNSKQNNAAL